LGARRVRSTISSECNLILIDKEALSSIFITSLVVMLLFL
jgi:hypothetical protein